MTDKSALRNYRSAVRSYLEICVEDIFWSNLLKKMCSRELKEE